MAKVTFIAELSFEVNDGSKLTEKEAYSLLQDGMNPWCSVWAPHVTIDIKNGNIDGHEFAT